MKFEVIFIILEFRLRSYNVFGGWDNKFDSNKQSLELQVQLPDIEKLSDLLGKAESCRARCGEILKDHISLKVSHMVNRLLQSFVWYSSTCTYGDGVSAGR